MKNFLKIIIFCLLLFLLIVLGFFFVGSPKQAKEISWGVNFSQKHSQKLGLNWRGNYLALLNDLGARRLKISTDWDLLEPENERYFFDDLDWQIKSAQESNSKIILVVGMKTGRWPECHVPLWAKNLSREEQQVKLLNLLEAIVLKYRESPSIEMWQVENEPLFPFGQCPWTDKNFLKREIEKVRYLDVKKRPIVVSDSGESSFWVEAARLGDVVGTTLYRKLWFDPLNRYVSYPLPPTFYWRKQKYIEKLFHKKVMLVELQAEPWGPSLLYDLSLEEQRKTMSPAQFKENVDFAKKAGFDTIYLWGGEWWYWLKEKQGQPQIWNEAKKLFIQ